ncbi:MAG: NifU family protein [Coprobacillus sp.]|nr:NifU family protein [Coprobacillus sp.]
MDNKEEIKAEPTTEAVSNGKSEEETIKEINKTLDKLRHFLQRDGGDVEFISYEDGIVYVSMSGACADCFLAYDDIKQLVEVILQEEVEGVLEVRLADYDRIQKAKGLTESSF